MQRVIAASFCSVSASLLIYSSLQFFISFFIFSLRLCLCHVFVPLTPFLTPSSLHYEVVVFLATSSPVNLHHPRSSALSFSLCMSLLWLYVNSLLHSRPVITCRRTPSHIRTLSSDECCRLLSHDMGRQVLRGGLDVVPAKVSLRQMILLLIRGHELHHEKRTD